MKRWSRIILIIVSLAIIVGCSNAVQEKDSQVQAKDPNKVVTTKKPADYFPLSKGSYWEYLGEGNEYASFNRKVLFTKGGQAQISEDNGGTVITRIFELTDSDVKLVYFEGETYQAANLLEAGFVANNNTISIKSPIQVGTTWTDKDGVKEIIAVDAQVDTPLGKLDNCIKIKITSSYDVLYRYYKKDIGMVKQEFISGDTTITSTLKNYKIE